MSKEELMELIEEYGEMMFALFPSAFTNTKEEQERREEIAVLLEKIKNNI